MSLLALSDVHGGYGEADIIEGVSLEVVPLETVTIAGTNGSGKSTVVKAIMGLLPRVRGSIRFDGRDLPSGMTERRIGLGISYVPQVANVFPSLSVIENLEVVEGVAHRKQRIAELFERFPALAERRRSGAGSLSGGERQQLAFARALMPGPRLMVLDEPTAALAPALVVQVLGMIAELPRLGVTVLMVEQRARQALEISDRGYILEGGRVVLSGTARDLLENEEMAELYLGRGDGAQTREGEGGRT